MVSQLSKIVLFTSAFVLYAAAYAEAKVGADCMSNGKPDDWKCDDGEYCHYKREKCQKAKSGCILSAQQITCLLLTGEKSLIKGTERLACEVATKNTEKRELCKEIYKQLDNAATSACGVALTHVCSPDSCPENHEAEPCKKLNTV